MPQTHARTQRRGPGGGRQLPSQEGPGPPGQLGAQERVRTPSASSPVRPQQQRRLGAPGARGQGMLGGPAAGSHAPLPPPLPPGRPRGAQEARAGVPWDQLARPAAPGIRATFPCAVAD